MSHLHGVNTTSAQFGPTLLGMWHPEGPGLHAIFVMVASDSPHPNSLVASSFVFAIDPCTQELAEQGEEDGLVWLDDCTTPQPSLVPTTAQPTAESTPAATTTPATPTLAPESTAAPTSAETGTATVEASMTMEGLDASSVGDDDVAAIKAG